MQMETASKIDFKSFMIGTIEHVSATFVKDLRHLPDDKLNASPMGCARPPLELAAECAGYNNMIAGAIKGEPMEMPSPERIKAYYASIDTFDKAKEALETSSAALVSALNGASEEVLAGMATAPWGETMPLYVLVGIAASHMSYHDGQINYIQCLYGDGAMHWAE